MGLQKTIIKSGLIRAAILASILPVSFFIANFFGMTFENATAATTAIPTVTFTVDPLTAQQGENIFLQWSSPDADKCLASGSWEGDVGKSGTRNITVYNNSSFILTCSNAAGQNIQIRPVTVTSSIRMPEVTITSNFDKVYLGAFVNLTWSVNYANSCYATGEWSGVKDPYGASEESKQLDTLGKKYFILICEGDGGVQSGYVAVDVVESDAGRAPTLKFTSDATAGVPLPYNSSVTFGWETDNVAKCTASNDSGISLWSGEKGPGGTQIITSLTSGSHSFTMICYTSDGRATLPQTITVNVVDQLKPTMSHYFIYNGQTYSADPAYINPTPYYIPYGVGIRLYWSVQNAQRCKISGRYTADPLPTLQGNYGDVYMYSSVNSVLQCLGMDGIWYSSTLPITVDAQPINFSSFTADWYVVTKGTNNALRWDVSGATQCKPVSSGSYSYASTDVRSCPKSQGSYNCFEYTGPLNNVGTYTYQLKCTGANFLSGAENSFTREVSIGVLATAAGGPSGLSDFTFVATNATLIDTQPNVLTYEAPSNSYVRLEWSAPQALGCIASGDFSGIKEKWGTSSQFVQYSATKQQYIYDLTCSNNTSMSRKTVIVNVLPTPTPKITIDPDNIMMIGPDANYTLPYGSDGTIYFKVDFNEQPLTGSDYCYAQWKNPEDTWQSVKYASWDNTRTAGSVKFGYVTVPSYWLAWPSKNVYFTCWSSKGFDQKIVTFYIGNPADGPELNFWSNGCSNDPEAGLANNQPVECYLPKPSGITLKWEARNTTYCTASGSWSGWQKNPGRFDVTLSNLWTDQLYFLQCVGANGVTKTKAVNAYVGVTTPKITFWSDSDMSSNGDTVIPYNTATTLRWNVLSPLNDPVTCTGENNNDKTWPPSEIGRSGSYDTSKLNNLTLYKIVCTNSQGSTSALLSIGVGTSTAIGPQVSFWTDSYVADSSGNATLKWSTAGASSCIASGADDWKGSMSTAAGTRTLTVAKIYSEKTYFLVCKGPSGNVSSKVTIVPSNNAPVNETSVEIWADLESNIPIDGGTTIRWKATNVKDGVCAFASVKYKNENGVIYDLMIPGGEFSGSRSMIGNQAVSGLQLGQYDLVLQCENMSSEKIRSAVRLYVGKSGSGMPIEFYEVKTVSDAAMSNANYSPIGPVGAYMVPYSTILNPRFLTFSWYATDGKDCTLTDDIDSTEDAVLYAGITNNGINFRIPDTLTKSAKFTLTCLNEIGLPSSAILYANVYRFEVCANPNLVEVGNNSDAKAMYYESSYTDTDPIILDNYSCPDSGTGDVTDGVNFSVGDGSILGLNGKVLTGKADGSTTLSGSYDAGFGTLNASSTVSVITKVDCYSCNTEIGRCAFSSRKPVSCSEGEYLDVATCNSNCVANMSIGNYIEVNPLRN